MGSKEEVPLHVYAENGLNPRSKCSIPCRYSLAILASMGFCVVYALRVNLSVALVAMVNSTYIDANADSQNPECEERGNLKQTSQNGEFNWDEKTQGIILGSFFYGYILTQIPGGWGASKFGGKHLFGLGVLCTSVFTLLTPLAAHHSLGSLIVLRVLEGLGEGVTFPAMHALWSSWAPPLERSKLLTLTYAGSQLGTIISLPISGLLCASDFLGGWPSVFYIFGSVGVVWYIAWSLLVYNKPADHPRISPEEKEYILHSIGKSQDIHRKKHKTPWFDIWTSSVVWAIIIAHFCNNWGFYTFLTSLPSYFKEVLNFKILENGILSAVPYTAQYMVIILSGQLADWLRNSRISTTNRVRKVFTIGGLVAPACLLVSTSYTGCNDRELAVGLFSAALGLTGIASSGFNINHLDVAPRYAGVLMGITNSFATIPGIIAPYVTGWLTNDEPTRGQWQKVFYLSAIIYIIGAVCYSILGSGNEQKWNTPEDELLVQVDLPREERQPLPIFRNNDELLGAANGFRPSHA